MAWSKAYTRITWVNEPSTDTPLNATNLNKMDAALNEVDNRVLQLQGSAYVHIKYSAYASPTNIQMSDVPNVYMGICVTSEETSPTTAATYTWNRVRGEKVLLQVSGGYIQWKYESDASWTNLIDLLSLKGDTGAKGDKGDTGAAFTYADFTPAQLAALKGANGTDGADGAAGADGADGRGIVSVTRTNGTGAAGTTDTYTITYTDNTTSTFYVYNGADGAGAGDMLKVTYDPNNKAANVYDADNHVSGTTNKVYTATEKTKLAGISDNANNYTHPANHPPSIITQDENNRFVTDTEKSTWSGKQAALGFTPVPNTRTVNGKALSADVSLAADDVGAVPTGGGTMTGALTLSDAPTANLHAATKKYVDDNIPNISGKLDKSGGTMTGQLVAQANTAYTTYQVRNIALSTTAAVPTGTGALLGVYS